MSRTKREHTPGPWSVGQYPEDPNNYIVTHDQTICTTDQGYYESAAQIDTAEQAANAALIAAAPDLLEALEILITHAPNNACETKIRALIAKAKGGE
jgi:hypothetical protein